MSDRVWDVAIVGAGPCGSALALLLARSGLSVLLVDKGPFRRPHAGEMAGPRCRPLLAKLGLERLSGPPFATVVPSIQSVWGDEEIREHNFIVSPDGPGLQLDREAFDSAIAATAAAAGATVLRGTAAKLVRADDGGHRVVLGEGRVERADYVAICDGRYSTGAGKGVQRLFLNDHVAIVATVPYSLRTRSMLVETVPQGWVYALSQPDGNGVIILTTRRQMAIGAGHRLQLWQSAVHSSRLLRHRLDHSQPPKLRVYNSPASAAKRIGGPDWCLLGDARFSLDPLSGDGVFHALDDAVTAAEEVMASGRDRLAELMRQRSKADLKIHTDATIACYGSETRFAEHRFWSGE
ncbi:MULTISPECIES: NAD(P)/FAD-dependent oxidoreductase [unclassified Mesorhizobium]|uniref:NAD(P)/FAD-dependent oxidoreductase n=1 Tax=unclassified Mesorhizobium TaxID=325217 RepID=UPI0003CDDE68|nr:MULTISPECIES: NAD(P)/FAD-dependent oxidoreductase [unclassified Mesorhizobium]ESY55558.1 hypothetical protein X745_11875 [Mesorhizobium sp. LNJC374B00]ESY57253.1 hypothetical protein X744_19325 [Mesorhizobium sp. LNJC372A00]WJI79394.1 NAD(P)/FAD-dependent oxidoreductase [Mesorhizobium sp. C374B]WJI85929.1 NAD(P)/FAD-dependent oxidoreductase [Mesorhizobium sp. C372A]